MSVLYICVQELAFRTCLHQLLKDRCCDIVILVDRPIDELNFKRLTGLVVPYACDIA